MLKKLCRIQIFPSTQKTQQCTRKESSMLASQTENQPIHKASFCLVLSQHFCIANCIEDHQNSDQLGDLYHGSTVLQKSLESSSHPGDAVVVAIKKLWYTFAGSFIQYYRPEFGAAHPSKSSS